MNLSIKKKSIKILLALLGIAVAFYLLLSQITFTKVNVRPYSHISISSRIDQKLNELATEYDSPETIIKKCADLTCEELSFSYKNDLEEGKANCIGYAQYTSEIINRTFRKKGLPYHAIPVVGKLSLFGVDLHQVARRILPNKYYPFFHDHDFVEVKEGNRIIIVDSSLQDLLGKHFLKDYHQ